MLNKSEIKYRIEHNPAYGFLVLELEPNQTAIVEAGGMAAMDSSIKMESKMKGDLVKVLAECWEENLYF